MLCVLPGLAPASSSASTESRASRQGGTCEVTADPRCASSPPGILPQEKEITFSIRLSNRRGDGRSVRFIAVLDLFKVLDPIDIPDGGSDTKRITMQVGAATARLHPKAWCAGFVLPEERGAATGLFDALERILKKGTKADPSLLSLRDDHFQKRGKIATLEKALIRAVEKQADEAAILDLKKQLSDVEEEDSSVLRKIEAKDQFIAGAYGKMPDATAIIVELDLIAFEPPNLEPPKLIGPDQDFDPVPPPPKFLTGPSRVPDDKEVDPGVDFQVNNDNDNSNLSLDFEDLGNAFEDDLLQFWWFFGRPVDSALADPGLNEPLSINTLTLKLMAWKTKVKVIEETFPIVISPREFDRDRRWLERIEPSVNREGERIEARFGVCKDAFHTLGSEIQFLDKDKNKIDPLFLGLHVTKLDEAFNRVAPRVLVPKPDFIDIDPDRFFIRVIDHRKSAPGFTSVITVFVSSAEFGLFQLRQVEDAKDAGFFHILTETGPGSGIFESKSLLLVADDVDDDFAGATEAVTGSLKDNEPNDRTIKVKLGGAFPLQGAHLAVEHSNVPVDPGTKPHPLRAPIKICNVSPKEERKTKVHFIIMQARREDLLLPAVDREQAEDDLKSLKEIFLQACLDVELVAIEFRPDPIDVDTLDGVEESVQDPNQQFKTRASDAEVALIRGVSDLPALAPDAKDHIDIIYIHHFNEQQAPTVVSSTLGDSMVINNMVAGQEDLVQVSIIGRHGMDPLLRAVVDFYEGRTKDVRRGYTTVPHEAGHHLGPLGHVDIPSLESNLMFDRAVGTNRIGGFKRLTPNVQIPAIRTEKPYAK